MKNYNVLVFPGGTETGLEIHKALKDCRGITLFSTGQNYSNHATVVFKKQFILNIYKENWLVKLNEIVEKYHIDCIYPSHPDVVLKLAENANHLKATAVISPLNTCRIARSKLQTYNLFDGIIPTPKIFETPSSVDEYPVFVKPERGAGASGTRICNNRQELNCAIKQCEDALILEYLPGKEYTIDCLSDRDRGLLFCNGRERVRIKHEIAMNSKLSHNPVFTEYAKKISDKLEFYGAWFFQVKQDKTGMYKLMEIEPRIAGTMALNRVTGVNFPLFSIWEQQRKPFRILINDLDISIDRAIVNTYKSNIKFDTVYLDLDDSLINRGKVDLNLIRFVFDCINKRKKIILLTKHDGDLQNKLKKHRINSLFDNIIHLDKDEHKSDYITTKKSIFIDDSFKERQEVVQKKGIPTFDCSMIEMFYCE
jgi:hypothetical protein